MAITIDNQKKSTTPITGLAQFSVVGFNLNKAQLAELGVDLKDEPEFLSTIEQVTQGDMENKIEVEVSNMPVHKMQVWLKMESELITEAYIDTATMQPKTRYIENPHKGRLFRITIPIQNREWVSTNKWTQAFTNGVGKTRWKASAAELEDWFKAKSPVYPTLRGLPTLYDFVLAWTNIDTSKSDSKVLLGDDPEAIKTLFEEGNTSIADELNSYAKALSDKNKMYALVGVDGGYMRVFDKVFLNETFNDSSSDRLYEQATGTYGFKADFQNSLALRKYDPMMSIAINDQTNNQPQQNNDAEDTQDDGGIADLPF